jgi:hypothetical protein
VLLSVFSCIKVDSFDQDNHSIAVNKMIHTNPLKMEGPSISSSVKAALIQTITNAFIYYGEDVLKNANYIS